MTTSEVSLAPAQQAMVALWEQHLVAEFRSKSAADAMDTMVERPYVNHVPTMTGGLSRPQLSRFYAHYFIPQTPSDVEMVPVSRTVGQDRIVDEFVFRFTHSGRIDWLLPGVPPTGRRVEIPMVVIVRFEEGRMASEHIYWDQASVLVQVRLLDPDALPVAGAETARKLLDPSLPSNALIKRDISDDEL